MTVALWSTTIERVADRLAALESLLSPDERKRAETFKVDDPRRTFIASRGLLRSILASYTKTPPDQILFEYGPKGKPSTPGGPPFNLAHSDGTLLFAISTAGEVGVDLEHIRTIDYRSLSQRYFSGNESTRLMALPEDQRARGFFSCWTRKEAYLKAIGVGIGYGLDTFDVSLGPDDPPALLANRKNPAETGRWNLATVNVSPNHVGAVCGEGDLAGGTDRPDLVELGLQAVALKT